MSRSPIFAAPWISGTALSATCSAANSVASRPRRTAVAWASSAGRMDRVSPHPVIPPAVSILRRAYSRFETGSRAIYALQLVMARRPEAARVTADCAASIGNSRALRTSVARMLVLCYDPGAAATFVRIRACTSCRERLGGLLKTTVTLHEYFDRTGTDSQREGKSNPIPVKY